MSKITGSFLVLVFVIIFSSILYIWQADREKRDLETQIRTQQETIASLETKVAQQPTPADIISDGAVLGETLDIVETGIISGTVTINNQTTTDALIVCATNVRTTQETCVDMLIELQKKSYDFSLELPPGDYEVYALMPPTEIKVYYSEVATCDESGNCDSKTTKKRQIQVQPDEAQSDINIYL